VHRLANNNGDVASGQLAVFQGASEAPISESYGSSEQRGKNGQLVPARRVALKMVRRPRCSSDTFLSIQICALSASPARTALPTAYFEGNDTSVPVDILCYRKSALEWGQELYRSAAQNSGGPLQKAPE
jgi:predicted transcriptional regulator